MDPTKHEQPPETQTTDLQTVEEKQNVSLFDASKVDVHGGTYYAVSGNATFSYTNVFPTASTAKDPSLNQIIDDTIAMLREYTDLKFGDIHRDIVDKRTPGTGHIFQSSTEVESWLKTYGSLLWATGGPGAGKTYLASAMYEFVESSQSDETPANTSLAIAYLRYTENLTAWDIIMAILTQLVEYRPIQCVLDAVNKTCSGFRRKNRRPSLVELTRLLRSVVKHFGRCFILIDGLDEMPGDIQGLLIEFISDVEANVLLTSRPLKLFQDKLHELRSHKPVFVTVAAQPEDLDLFITQAINRSPNLSSLLDTPQVRDEVLSTIKSKAQGMFLHATMQIEALRHCLDIQELREGVAKFPVGISALYSDTLRRIESQHPNHASRAKLALMWLVYSRGPLCIRDLQLAVSASPPDYLPKPDRELPEDLLIAICCGLITVDKESRQVRLIHLTARKPLRKLLSSSHPNPHTTITLTCLSRLTECNFQNSPIATVATLRKTLNKRALLQYASRSVSFHIQQALSVNNNSTSPDLLPIVYNFVRGCQSFPYYNAHLLKVEDDSRPIHKLSSLHVASLFNLPSLVIQLLEGHETSVNITTSRTQGGGWTSLMIASSEGHQAVVAALLTFPAILTNTTDSDGLTPLIAASMDGHSTVVKHLLTWPGPRRGLADCLRCGRTKLGKDQMVMVNQQVEGGLSSLMYAAQEGHDEVVRLLLSTPGIEVNQQDEEGSSALMIASHHGRDPVVAMLLSHPGIVINQPNQKSMSALMIASANGHTGVVQLLLAHPDLDVNQQEKEEGWSALMFAAKNGRRGVINLLLQSPSIAVNQQDNKGWSALMLASQSGHKGVVKNLLQTPDIAVNQQSSEGGTALIYASQDGRSGVVKLLLAHKGIRVNQQDNEGGSALMIASQNGRESVVGLLLSSGGIDVDQQDDEGTSALMSAAQQGHDGVVKLSIAVPDIQVNQQDDDGWSALAIASQIGHEGVVKALLEATGIDVNQQDKQGWSPLTLAAENNHIPILTLLLSSPKIDINISNNEGSTALICGSKCGHEGVVKLLLEHADIKVNHQEEDGLTALAYAVQFDHDAVVEALLGASDIDVNTRTRWGETPLLLASCHGHERGVKRLLEVTGIDIYAVDDDGDTALSVAKEGGHQAVVKLLRDFSANRRRRKK